MGGKPASAFVTVGAQAASASQSGTASASAVSGEPTSSVGGHAERTPSSRSGPLASCSVTSSGAGTANSVAKFTSACNIENSAIFESSGNVGIGTKSPAGTLDVNGRAFIRGTLQAVRLSAVRFADQFPGADMAAKINAAILDLPSTGGTVDACGFTGAQTWSSIGPITGITKPVVLLLGAATITVAPTGSAVLPSNCFMIGSGPGSTVLKAQTSTNMITIQAGSTSSPVSNVGVFNLEVDGGWRSAATGGINIQFQAVTGGWIQNCFLHDAGGANIGVDTNTSGPPSSQPRFPRLQRRSLSAGA